MSSSAPPPSSPVRGFLRSGAVARVGLGALPVIAVFWCLVRFVGLEVSPFGIWMDESRVALHTQCLVETGRTDDGQRWPLFANAFGGGHHPITLLAFDAAWMRLFGNSIAAFRAVSGLFILLTALGLALLARRVADARLGLLVFFAAALSPWSFQFSRVAWEGPLAPAFLIWSVYALVRAGDSGRGRWAWAALAGVLAGGAMYSYPPLRVTTPLVLGTVGLLLWRRRRATLALLLICLGALALTVTPIAVLSYRGEITGRTLEMAIFSSRWLDEHRGSTPRALFFIVTLLDNLAQHLRPSYLFFTGDPNHRHSAHLVGQLGPVDILALGWVLAWLVHRGWHHLARPRPQALEDDPLPRRVAALLPLAVLGGLYGTLPAALTWESLPHALRAIGAWPFVALFTGAALWLLLRRAPGAAALVALVALGHTAAYLPRYFTVYRDAHPETFRREIWTAVRDRGTRSAAEAVRPFIHDPQYGGELELRYYLIRYDGESCLGAARRLEELSR